MDSEIVRGKPLTKEETKALLGFIENSKVILSKTTNATNNKMKTEEWLRLTDMFNATATVHRRTPQQLRLKWENLKKNARKRSTKIRMNRIQTGGGQADYIPPDDVLDRVADLLGSTATGFVVPFGGDRESHSKFSGDGDSCSGDGFIGAQPEALPITYEDGLNLKSTPVSIDIPVSIDTSTSGPVCVDTFHMSTAIPLSNDTEASTSVPVSGCVLTRVPDPLSNVATPKRLTLSTPIRGKKKCKTDDGKAARNLAIEEYFKAKKLCLDAKNENILLQNEKLKLENIKLTLEVEQLQKK